MAQATEAYPLVFHPVVLEKVWGGRRLGALGKILPNAAAMYGESWEIADLDSTSSGGAGGQGVRSVIANGALAGRTIREAIDAWGDALLHRGSMTQSAFPLLIKFLDAREDLSVQVHPSPEYAAAHADAHLKTECWYIMDAEPGAKVYIGIRPGVTREEFARLARANDRAIVDVLISRPAVPGECHNLPSGTVHALGAGVLVAEVQTPSDTTFRLYDWGRTGRTLHVEESLKCATFEPPPAPVRLDGSGLVSDGLTTPYFTVALSRPAAAGSPLDAHAGRVLIAVGGAGEVHGGGGTLRVQRGTTLLVPRRCADTWAIRSSGDDPLEVLSVSMPTRTPRVDAAHA